METLTLITVSETLDEIAVDRALELYEFALDKGWPFIWRIGVVRLIFNSNGGS